MSVTAHLLVKKSSVQIVPFRDVFLCLSISMVMTFPFFVSLSITLWIWCYNVSCPSEMLHHVFFNLVENGELEMITIAMRVFSRLLYQECICQIVFANLLNISFKVFNESRFVSNLSFAPGNINLKGGIETSTNQWRGVSGIIWILSPKCVWPFDPLNAPFFFLRILSSHLLAIGASEKYDKVN